MNLESRIKKIEQNFAPVPDVDVTELADDELIAILGRDREWLSKLSDEELEAILKNEH